MGVDLRVAAAAQAHEVARAWSPPGAPETWALTAAMFRAIAEEDALLDLAATIPFDRVPALLLSAAIRHLLASSDSVLRRYFPVVGGEQPPLDDRFRPELVDFARAYGPELEALCREHRYQMNEVRRSADVVAALSDVDRPIALVDLGTGAGLGLQLDRYRYDVGGQVFGDEGSPVELVCEGRGPLPRLAVPEVAARVGVDIEPLDLGDPGVRAWLAACVPPEIGAVNRFAAACDVVLAHPAPLVRADVTDIRSVLSSLAIPDAALLVLVDTYVHVFFTPEQQSRFRSDLLSVGRDLEWVSVDPELRPGHDTMVSVQGLALPHRAMQATMGGVTGIVGRLSVRDGAASGRVLALAHPSGQWLEWL